MLVNDAVITEPAIALELRFVEELIRSRLLWKLLLRPCVRFGIAVDIKTLIATEHGLDVKQISVDAIVVNDAVTNPSQCEVRPRLFGAFRCRQRVVFKFDGYTQVHANLTNGVLQIIEGVLWIG